MALDALPPIHEKRPAVREMFDRIAPRYDLVNRLMTFGLDQRWRRCTLDALDAGPGDVVLDLACGTGDLAEEAARRGARVVGADFALEMLRGAVRREVGASLVQGDGAALPFADGCITACSCGFALRNFASLPEVFAEIARVLAPGGRVALLDVDRPRNRAMRAGHSFYFDRVVPKLGAVLSDRRAYAYLPQSTVYLPPAVELRALLREAGFDAVGHRTFLGGSVQLLTGRRR